MLRARWRGHLTREPASFFFGIKVTIIDETFSQRRLTWRCLCGIPLRTYRFPSYQYITLYPVFTEIMDKGNIIKNCSATNVFFCEGDDAILYCAEILAGVSSVGSLLITQACKGG